MGTEFSIGLRRWEDAQFSRNERELEEQEQREIAEEEERTAIIQAIQNKTLFSELISDFMDSSEGSDYFFERIFEILFLINGKRKGFLESREEKLTAEIVTASVNEKAKKEIAKRAQHGAWHE